MVLVSDGGVVCVFGREGSVFGFVPFFLLSLSVCCCAAAAALRLKGAMDVRRNEMKIIQRR